jgi:hypothetical protein
MKKELLAVLLLVSILIACLINIRCVTGLTEELAAMVDDAEAQASSGNWEGAGTRSRTLRPLERRNLYTVSPLP